MKCFTLIFCNPVFRVCRVRLPAFYVSLLFGAACLPSADAEVRLAPGFSSGMVLQRDVPSRISGWAAEGEKIQVQLGEHVVAEAVGRGEAAMWAVALPVFKAGSLPDLVIRGNNTITLTNLLAGDVWVCSGQSNMEMTLAKGPWCDYGGAQDADKEVAAANHPQLRLFNAREPSGWIACTPETARKFSAAAYFFGRDLSKDLGVPIGLVMAAVGGTAAEYWLPRSTLESRPGFAEAVTAARLTLEELGPADAAFRKALADWQKASKQAEADGVPPPPKPVTTLDKDQQERMASARVLENAGLYFAKRIEPLTAMPIKGAIWYQGEANITRHAEYADLMTRLIASWRKAWNQEEMPFLIMQLVNFGSRAPAGDHLWAELRAAQQAVVDSVPNSGLAVGIDIGDPKNIHPANKQEVGRRLARLALNLVYGREVVCSGPKPVDVRFEAGATVVEFDQPVVLQTGEESGFELADREGVFHPAKAQAGGNTIILSTPEVPEPSEIRYAWRDNPASTVSNAEGLPAAPFRKGRQQP